MHSSRTPLLLRLSTLASLGALAAACSVPDGQVVATSTSQAITQTTAVSRAMEWVGAKLQYCQSAYGQRDYDTACSAYCYRESNSSWNSYRSDCSGFVTWAWGLPPVGDGGYVTGNFAPFDNSFSHAIDAIDLQPGDAANRNSGDHIVLFKEWVTKGTEAVFMEEPGCSSSTPYAHEFTSSVSTSGHDIYISYEGTTFTAIRYDGITSAPPPPPPPPKGAPTKKPTAPTGCDAIKPGQGLAVGESISSCDGRLKLEMQTDGNLVLYLGSTALWATDTYGTDGYAAIMQTDGNFVVYGKYSNALWASKTNGHSGADIHLQDDGNLVVYSSGGTALWASGTNLPSTPPSPATCGTFHEGEGLTAGHGLSSCDGRYTLDMQTDGNLVLYEQGKGALWATATNSKHGYKLVLQSDGNFVLYSITGAALWATGTNGNGGDHVSLQSDGNLVVYTSGGSAVWASHT